MKKPVEQLTNDELFEEVIYWARVSRNETKLPEIDRQWLQSVIAEINKRGLKLR